MEHYFSVHIWRLRSLQRGPKKTKNSYIGWFRSHDSSHPDWEGAIARVQSLKDFLRGEAGDFSDEQIITARGGSYNWSWRNGMNDCIIEITKIDFGRVYDWDDVGPDVE